MPKVNELKPGTKILLPCARCGHKRSVTFYSVAQYSEMKKRICVECAAGDLAEDSGHVALFRSPNIMKTNYAAMQPLDSEETGPLAFRPSRRIQ